MIITKILISSAASRVFFYHQKCISTLKMNSLRICLAQFGPKKINKITGRLFSASISGSDSQDTKSAEIKVGQSCSVRRSFSATDVEQFAKLTGDYNPLHFDDQFARRFNFSKAIVHGALING